jgi:hypothetical protein
MKRLDGIVGPGGYAGMSALSEVIQNKYSLGLAK